MKERVFDLKLYRIISENKFFLKLMLTYCLVILIGLGLTSYFVTSNMTRILTDKESNFENEVIQKVKVYSADKYKIIKSIFSGLYMPLYFNNNTSIVDYINPAKATQINSGSKFSAISSYLYDTCSANSFITDILIVDYHNREVFFSSNLSGRDASIDYDFFKIGFLGDIDGGNSIEIIPNYIPDYVNNASSGSNFPVITFCLYLFDQNSVKFDKPLGIAAINVRADFFKEAYRDSVGFKGNILVIADNSFTLFDSSGKYTGLNFAFDEFSASSVSDLISNEKYIVNKYYSDEMKFSFIDIVDRGVIKKETEGIRKSIVNIITLCVAVTLLISIISASAFATRIKLLVINMKDVENGKLDTRINVGSRDEIGYLEQSFNTMCVKLEEYIENVYVFEIKTKTAELKALQAQIDPHFLFNTLESIRVTAQINNDVQAAKMIHILGGMFRWNIKMKGMFVDLKEEIDYVRSYIELQRLRHDNMMGFFMDIESAALKFGVPKLILQPLVENAINHGLSNNTSTGHIKLEVALIDGKLVSVVSDNGKGMSDEKIKEVIDSLAKDKSQKDMYHIGLRNIQQRISILFGAGYGIKISSTVGIGTEITLSIPALRKEEMERYVQGSNSR